MSSKNQGKCPKERTQNVININFFLSIKTIPATIGANVLKTGRKRAKMIATVTANRYMSPWPADASYSHFVDEKILSNHEIELNDKWVKEGCVMGDSSELPATPVFSNGSQLGIPDLVIKMDKPYKIKGDNLDRFLLMKLPIRNSARYIYTSH